MTPRKGVAKVIDNCAWGRWIIQPGSCLDIFHSLVHKVYRGCDHKGDSVQVVSSNKSNRLSD